jgi:hypothetical protein
VDFSLLGQLGSGGVAAALRDCGFECPFPFEKILRYPKLDC